mgnify:CR=1 FL=1
MQRDVHLISGSAVSNYLLARLQRRFDLTDPVELLKFFGVGLLLEEHMDQLSPEQALILGYVCVCVCVYVRMCVCVCVCR